MTVAEAVLNKLRQLPEEQQRQVLVFVEKIEAECAAQGKARSEAYACCADLRTDLPFEVFQENRRQMWGTAGNEEL